MTIELLYTSAAQGLKQGSRGFCTVICTAGLPINLAQRLESLSGYRHLYQPGDQRAEENPVCHSHIRLAVGGKTLSILSRVGAYGVDYSQRTNKIAHHVVFDGPVPECGPAAVLAQSGIMRTNWDGECKTLQSGPEVSSITVQPAPCKQWKRITGDAGWAGVVANAWLQPTGKPVWIVFSESQSTSLLDLMQEATAILPESRRWQATFSTYCTNLPPDVECRVRCVIAGSDEARMSIARGSVLDLTKPMGNAHVNDAANAARHGFTIGETSNFVPSVPELSNFSDQTIEEIEAALSAHASDGSEYQLQQQIPGRLPIPLAMPNRRPGNNLKRKGSKSQNGQSKFWKVLAVAAVVLVFFSLVGVGVFYIATTQNPVADSGDKTLEQEAKRTTQKSTESPLIVNSDPQPDTENSPIDAAPPPESKIEIPPGAVAPSDHQDLEMAGENLQTDRDPVAIPDQVKPASKSDENKTQQFGTAKLRFGDLLVGTQEKPPTIRIELPIDQLQKLNGKQQYRAMLKGIKGNLENENRLVVISLPLSVGTDDKNRFIGFELPREFSGVDILNSWLKDMYLIKKSVVECRDQMLKSMNGMKTPMSIAFKKFVEGLDPAKFNHFELAMSEIAEVDQWLKDLEEYLRLKDSRELLNFEKRREGQTDDEKARPGKGNENKQLEYLRRLDGFRNRFGYNGEISAAIPSSVLRLVDEKPGNINVQSTIDSFLSDCKGAKQNIPLKFSDILNASKNLQEWAKSSGSQIAEIENKFPVVISIIDDPNDQLSSGGKPLSQIPVRVRTSIIVSE